MESNHCTQKHDVCTGGYRTVDTVLDTVTQRPLLLKTLTYNSDSLSIGLGVKWIFVVNLVNLYGNVIRAR